jgi:hypothetical protein
MRTKMNQLARSTSFLAIPLITKVEIHENTHGSLHWMRTRIFSECPSCHGTHNKQIFGWNKLQCENCGNIWIY